MTLTQQMQGVSLLKPVIQAGIQAIIPLFGAPYTDELGQPFTIQLRGSYSTERREVPNVEVSFRPSSMTFFSGQNIIGFDQATGMYLYGFYLQDSILRYTVQGRSEAEREWLIDSLSTGFTGLVFTDPSSGAYANNNVVDYLGSQGIVVTGFDALEYPSPPLDDPRPEGQVYEATLPVRVTVSLAYEMPGFSATSDTLTKGFTLDPSQTPYWMQ